MKNYLAVLALFLPTFFCFSQQIGYEVLGVQTSPYASPYALLTLDTLQEAETLRDINARYRPDWVASYIAVAVSTTCNGLSERAVGKNNVLTEEQLRLLKAAQPDCNIEVQVDYIPNNTLKHNPARQMQFSLRAIPIFEAKFPGGYQELEQYLEKNIVDQAVAINQVELAKIKFRISAEGEVTNARLSQTSGNEQTDELMLKAICSMPLWTPAEDSAGMKISQEFEFSIGTALLRCDYRL